MPDRIILSGATGAVGGYLLADIAARYPQAEIVCVVRSAKSAQRLEAVLGEPLRSRVRPLILDLAATPQSLAGVDLSPVEACLGVHCAGDVSWTKSETVLAPLNVGGTAAFADLLLKTSRQPPSMVFLSTAFLSDAGEQRNGYETTKLQAEQLLETAYGQRLRWGVVRCSLVVGDTRTGRIPRFNGLYPLIRLVALAEVPCIIADPDYRIDTIPIDYVAEQVAACAEALGDGATAVRLTAAAGPLGAVRVTHLVHAIQERTGRLLLRHGATPLPPISVIRRRQYRFLMEASKSWDMVDRFAKVELISELMEGYIVHGETGRPLQPRAIGAAPPAPESYLSTVIDYWLEQNLRKVLEPRRREWLGEPEPSA